MCFLVKTVLQKTLLWQPLVCVKNRFYTTYTKNFITHYNKQDIDSFLESIQIKDASDKEEIKKRYLDGETVFYGELSDSGDYGGMIEAFYSHESLVVIGDDIYLNLRNSVY